MKRTKLALLALCLLGTGTAGFSQKLFVSANVGYNMGVGMKGLVGNSSMQSSASEATFSNENVALSFGKGLNVGGSLGYMFTENVGAELGVSYLIGGKTETEDKNISETSTDITKMTFSANMFRVNPSLIFSAGRTTGFNPYLKMGVVIGMGKVLVVTDENDNGDKIYQEEEFTGGTSFGFSSAIGATKSLSDKIDLFGELNYIGMGYAPTKSEITKATYNGVDMLPMIDMIDKKTEYSDKTQASSATASDPTQPSRSTKTTLPFSSFGLNVGIRLKF